MLMVLATLLNGASKGAEAQTQFQTTMTGEMSKDTEYKNAGVMTKDGTYHFTKDTLIKTENKNGGLFKGKTSIVSDGILTFDVYKGVKNKSEYIVGIDVQSEEGVTIKAKKIQFKAKAEESNNKLVARVEGLRIGGQGFNNAKKPHKLHIIGDVDFDVQGMGYTLGVYAGGNSDVTIDGNVTAMGNLPNKFGVFAKIGSGWSNGCSVLYAGSNYTLQQGPKFHVTGNVYAKANANGLYANGGHSILTVDGGGYIEMSDTKVNSYYDYCALRAESGTVNMNVKLDADGNPLRANLNDLIVKGNIGALASAVHPNEPETWSKVNVAFATKNSSWTGIAFRQFDKNGQLAGDKYFYGAINIYLQNGATWTHTSYGTEPKSGEFGSGYVGTSNIHTFVGGEQKNKSGIICQVASWKHIDIDKYKGYTTVFYKHKNKKPKKIEDGYKFKNSLILITSAAVDSQITLLTDDQGLDLKSTKEEDKKLIRATLNNLAGMLYYRSYKEENHLMARVGIAESLLSSSILSKITFEGKDYSVPSDDNLGIITFKKYGQGEYREELPATTVPIKERELFTKERKVQATINDAINNGADKYIVAIYNSTKDRGMTVNMNRQSLLLHADAGDNIIDTSLIMADGKDINLINGKEKTPIHMTVATRGKSYGILAKNGGSVTIGHDIVLDKVEGETAIGIQATGAKVTLLGGKINTNKNVANNQKALYAKHSSTADSIISINMNKENTSAKDYQVEILGDIKTEKSTQANGKKGIVYLGLNTPTSLWKGVSDYTQDKTHETSFGDIYLYLANSAIWKNEKTATVGRLDPSTFEGSKIKKLTGGDTRATAGIIFQKDTHPILIENYSGNTIFYFDSKVEKGIDANDNPAKIPEIKGGQIIIQKAEQKSHIYLRTASPSFNFTSTEAIEQNLLNATLNALANKLIYQDYAKNPRNLIAHIEIAEGYLNPAVKITKEITTFEKTTKKDGLDLTGKEFNQKAGEGAYIYKTLLPSTQTKNAFTTPITGTSIYDKAYKNSGVLQENVYNFTKDTTIKTQNTSAIFNTKTKKDISIETHLANLDIKAQDFAIEAGKKNKITLLGDKKVTLKGTKGSILAHEEAKVQVKAEGLHLLGNLYNKGGKLKLDSGNDKGSFTGNLIQTGGDFTLKLNGKNSSFIGDIKNNKGKILIELQGEDSIFQGKVEKSASRSTADAILTEIRLGKKGVAKFTDHSTLNRLVLGEKAKITLENNKQLALEKLDTQNSSAIEVKENAKFIVSEVNSHNGLSLQGKGSIKAQKLNLGGTLKKIDNSKVEIKNAVIKKDAKFEIDGDGLQINTLTLANTSLENNSHQDLEIQKLETTDGKLVLKTDSNIKVGELQGKINIIKEAKVDDKGKIQTPKGKFIFQTVNTKNKDNKIILTAIGLNLEDEALGSLEEKHQKEQKNKNILLDFYQKTIQADIKNDKFKQDKNYKDDQGTYTQGYSLEGLTVAINTQEDFTKPSARVRGNIIYDKQGKAVAIKESKVVYGDYETMIMQSTKGAMLSSAMIWRTEMNDLMKRMGDLRLVPNDKGIWLKIYHGKASSYKYKASYKLNFTTTQLGYDFKTSDAWHVGFAGSYMKSNGNYKTGTGSSNLGSLGIYATWKNKSGEYLDIIGKIGRLKNSFSVTNDIGSLKASGTYHTWGKSLSMEYGKRFIKDSYYYEPQLELSLGTLDKVDYDLSAKDYKTMQVQESSLTSTISRLGIAIGQNLLRSSYFMKASLFHEFAGSMDTTWQVKGQEHKKTSMGAKDTWLALSLGGTFKMSEQSLLYASFEKTFGGDIKTIYRIDAGMRFSF